MEKYELTENYKIISSKGEIISEKELLKRISQDLKEIQKTLISDAV